MKQQSKFYGSIKYQKFNQEFLLIMVYSDWKLKATGNIFYLYKWVNEFQQ